MQSNYSAPLLILTLAMKESALIIYKLRFAFFLFLSLFSQASNIFHSASLNRLQQPRQAILTYPFIPIGT